MREESKGALSRRQPSSLTPLLTAIAPLTWGTTYVVTTELLPADHPLWSGVLRALPAGLLALALTRQLPRGRWWGRALALGVLNIGAFFPFLFLAAYLLPGNVAGIFGALGPLLVAVLAAALLGERPATARLVWGALAVLGYAWLALAGTLLAYTLWFRGLGRMSAGTAAFLPVLSPLVAALLGLIVLGEALTAVQAAGFALALIAVVASQRPSRPRGRAA